MPTRRVSGLMGSSPPIEFASISPKNHAGLGNFVFQIARLNHGASRMLDGFDSRLEQTDKLATATARQALMEQWKATISPLIDQQFNATQISSRQLDYRIIELKKENSVFEGVLVQRVFECHPNKCQIFFTLHCDGYVNMSADFIGALDYVGTPIAELKAHQIEQAFLHLLAFPPVDQ